MRLSGTQSWQISVGTNHLIDCALWIRAAERLAVPEDPLVPGPQRYLVPDHLCGGAQWANWLRELVARVGP